LEKNPQKTAALPGLKNFIKGYFKKIFLGMNLAIDNRQMTVTVDG